MHRVQQREGAVMARAKDTNNKQNARQKAAKSKKYAQYRSSMRREKSRLRDLKKHIERNPNDLSSYGAAIEFATALGEKVPNDWRFMHKQYEDQLTKEKS